MPDTWPATATLIYHERGIWWGSTRLSVDGQGQALLNRSRFGHADKDIPAGVYRATLSRDQTDTLAGLLRKHDFTTSREESLTTDAGETTLVLSLGGTGGLFIVR